MKAFKKILGIGLAVVAAAAVSVSAFAAYLTPAQAVADLTGRDVKAIIDERNTTGKTYAAMAEDAGKLAEYKESILSLKKSLLDERVAGGFITQAQADEAYALFEERIALCDGTGTACGAASGSCGLGGIGAGICGGDVTGGCGGLGGTVGGYGGACGGAGGGFGRMQRR